MKDRKDMLNLSSEKDSTIDRDMDGTIVEQRPARATWILQFIVEGILPPCSSLLQSPIQCDALMHKLERCLTERVRSFP